MNIKKGIKRLKKENVQMLKRGVSYNIEPFGSS